MKLFKRYGMWQVEYRDANGKRQRKSTGLADTESEKAAERAASARIQRVLIADHATAPAPKGTPIHAVVNLAEALERTYIHRWQKTKSDIQLKYVVRRVEREIGHWLLKEIDYNRLEAYQTDILKQGKTAATVNRRMSLLKVVLRHCLQKGDLTGMPAFPESLQENNIKERYLTVDEEATILEWLKAKSMAEAYTPGAEPEWMYMRALAIVLLDTGCRLTEALTITKTDGKVVHLKYGTTKNNKARVIPLTPRASKSLELMLANRFHGKVDNDWVGHRWMLVRRECKVEDVNIHVLRHTCASRLLAAKVDLYTVSKWLGHSSVKITERYAHLQSGALEQAAAALAGGPVAVPDLHMRKVSA